MHQNGEIDRPTAVQRKTFLLSWLRDLESPKILEGAEKRSSMAPQMMVSSPELVVFLLYMQMVPSRPVIWNSHSPPPSAI